MKNLLILFAEIGLCLIITILPGITETTTQKKTQPATDSDGWITKWY
ncbi:MAG: hypothetical protein NC397_09550 [Clostridium sp.]|nr:hypothetical protein [Clostridium sp.]